ncbi:MAG: helix-turn-helix transcriptional regulator [Oscillospiraceae bacterium]|nr:helix-turn-helix transcriptional regulator [Oscillospiraceae bacterium]
MNQQETGRFIAEKRRAKNLTQEQLAEMIGVSNKTVSKWETGGYNT